ncbi:MAG: hypothetical protein KatS3mg019_1135 [Fimbriimonadales bacterium]|nr:MAG: hypothetical protein KatS3mg019_1135 [Fimbriimonadales bacterium]
MSGRWRYVTGVVVTVLVWMSSYAQPDRLAVEWIRYPNYANSPTFSPDGLLFAATGDGVVYVYTLPSWTPKCSFPANAQYCRFSPDGRHIATLGGDGIARLWDIEEGSLRQTFSVAPDPGRGLQFDGTGRRIAVMGYRVRVWDTATGALLFESASAGGRFAFAPNGRYLAMEGEPATQHLWVFDVDTGNRVASFTPEWGLQLEAIAFSPDNSTLAFTTRNTTYLVRTDTWQVRAQFIDWSQTSGYRALGFSPDSQLLYATGGYGFENNQDVYPLRIRRSSNGALIRSVYLNSQYFAPNAIAVSPDGAWVAMGRTAPIEVYHTPTATLQLKGEFMDPVYDIAVAPSGEWYVAAESLRWATRRDARTGERAYRTPEGGHIQTALAVAISPDETRIATGGQDSRICLWNAETGMLERILTGSLGAVLCVAFLDDGTTLLSVGADGIIRLWSVDTGTLIRYTALGIQVHAARLSADKQWLAIGGQDRRVRLFRVSDLTQVAQSAPFDAIPNSFALAPSGQQIAVGLSSGAYFMLDTSSMTIRSLGSFNTKSVCLAFTRDGRHLVVGAPRVHLLRFVDVHTGTVAFETRTEVSNGVRAIAFTPTGRSMIIARGDTAQLRVKNPLYRIGDVNTDGCVDDADLLALLMAFGDTGVELPADGNDDGIVDDADLLALLFHFGNGC